MSIREGGQPRRARDVGRESGGQGPSRGLEAGESRDWPNMKKGR